MTVYIALLRGVNVGGNNRLPMKDWRGRLEASGFGRVRTYIQSGNAVVESELPSEEVAGRISADIEAHFGFAPVCHVLERERLQRALTDCPYRPQGEDAHKQVHVFFIKGDVTRYDAEGLSALATQGEAFSMQGGVFYLYTPEGFGKSVVAEKLTRFLKAEMTARNLRTLEALIEMAGEAT
ncbi:MAG: DUF1697 domain-containing protein [Asticcacaulis sp.]